MLVSPDPALYPVLLFHSFVLRPNRLLIQYHFVFLLIVSPFRSDGSIYSFPTSVGSSLVLTGPVSLIFARLELRSAVATVFICYLMPVLGVD